QVRRLDCEIVCPNDRHQRRRAGCVAQRESGGSEYRSRRFAGSFSIAFYSVGTRISAAQTIRPNLILLRAEILGDGLGAGADVKFAVDVTDVSVHGLEGDGEQVGDFLVGVTSGQQIKNFPFTRGQSFGG